MPRKPCENFLYGFKAAPRAARAADSARTPFAPACGSRSGGARCRSAGARTRGRPGPPKTGEVTRPRRI